MEKIPELEIRIKRALKYKYNQIEPPEEMLPNILANLNNPKVQRPLLITQKQYIAAFICGILIISATLMLSDNTRVWAVETINAVKSVFIMDKNHNIVQKPTNYQWLQPAYNKNTHLSDSALSAKMGVKVSFPQTINRGYKLQYKAEAVGFMKSIDYTTFQSLLHIAMQAIDNDKVFQSLNKYEPYRSVGAVYVNDKGAKVAAVVYNKKIPITSENSGITKTVETRVGNQNAKWVRLTYPVYPGNDLTQKPISMKSTSMLFWSIGNTTYQIWPMNNESSSLTETVSLAESFMQAQLSN